MGTNTRLSMSPRSQTVGQLGQWIQDNNNSPSRQFPGKSTTGVSKSLESPMSTVPSSRSLNKQQQDFWKQNPLYFQKLAVSNLACMKMLRHSIEGGDIEVLGMLLGHMQGETIVVVDSYGLPVEGTETRVNAQMESYEYIVQYLDSMVTDRMAIVGWYHSHPGYGCWLSGIDAETQALNQNFQDPYLAVVIDPKKSQENGVLEIGAFRTLPDCDNNAKSASSSTNDMKYGRHSSKYYELQVTYFEGKYDSSLYQSQLIVPVPKLLDADEEVLIRQMLGFARACRNIKKLQVTNRTFLPKNISSYNLDVSEQDISMEKYNGSDSVVDINPEDKHIPQSVIEDDYNDGGAINMGEHNVNMNNDSNSADIVMDTASVSSNDEQPQVAFQEASDSQMGVVENEYLRIKRELLLFKMQDYQKLRFYRDAFTL
ncbi:COP9 signalosome catalytic subunit RRI1 Ecym_6428 [Eremothecium cymbalariae DBVPG|uniref:COP9 signalosome complex subunit 5 n=1 Tax=Eremothecium cymbalariae (strain CBS 270.75 / DBVPG 7215 / KCTC 17166 / NRRL Y-17582) TaxID=931890 RepID=G8JUL9_ERECY|nr:hypothetical protein Ecym_6428 [Eremothecium cymbalariae DBVPG\